MYPAGVDRLRARRRARPLRAKRARPTSGRVPPQHRAISPPPRRSVSRCSRTRLRSVTVTAIDAPEGIAATRFAGAAHDPVSCWAAVKRNSPARSSASARWATSPNDVLAMLGALEGESTRGRPFKATPGSGVASAALPPPAVFEETKQTVPRRNLQAVMPEERATRTGARTPGHHRAHRAPRPKRSIAASGLRHELRQGPSCADRCAGRSVAVKKQHDVHHGPPPRRRAPCTPPIAGTPDAVDRFRSPVGPRSCSRATRSSRDERVREHREEDQPDRVRRSRPSSRWSEVTGPSSDPGVAKRGDDLRPKSATGPASSRTKPLRLALCRREKDRDPRR